MDSRPEYDLFLGGDFGDRTASVSMVDAQQVVRFAGYLRERQRQGRKVLYCGLYFSGLSPWVDCFVEEATTETAWLDRVSDVLRSSLQPLGSKPAPRILACIEKPYVAVQVPASRGYRKAHQRSIDPGQLRGIVAAGRMQHAVASALGVDSSELLSVMKSRHSRPTWQAIPQRQADKALAPVLEAGAEPGGDHLSDSTRIALWCQRYGPGVVGSSRNKGGPDGH